MEDGDRLGEKCHRLQEDGAGAGGILLVTNADAVAEDEDATGGGPYGEGVAGNGRVAPYRFQPRRDLIADAAQFQKHAHGVAVDDAIDRAHFRPCDPIGRQRNGRRGGGQKRLLPRGDYSLDIAAGELRGDTKMRGHGGSDFSQRSALAELAPDQPRSFVQEEKARNIRANEDQAMVNGKFPQGSFRQAGYGFAECLAGPWPVAASAFLVMARTVKGAA